MYAARVAGASAVQCCTVPRVRDFSKASQLMMSSLRTSHEAYSCRA